MSPLHRFNVLRQRAFALCDAAVLSRHVSVRIALVLVLALWAVPLAARADEPFVLERTAVYQPAYGDQFYGHVCWGNDEYFAAWLDLRVGGANPGGYDLYAQRIAPDGTIKEPGSLLLLRAGPQRTFNHPAVAWNGSVYLVAWAEATGIWGVRVSPQAQVLDAEGFQIDSTAGVVDRPSIAADGANFLVTYGTTRQILAKRVNSAGQVMDPAPLVIKAQGAEQVARPRAGFSAGEFLVVWAQAPQQAIRGCRITTTGTVLDAGGFNVSGGPATDVDPDLDSDGSGFLVTWQRLDGQGFFDMWGARVTAGGTSLGGALLTEGNSFGGVGGGHVAFNGANHLVSITVGEPVFSNTDQWAQLVSAEGSPVGPPFPVSTLEGTSQFAYGLASNGADFFMLWEDGRNTNFPNTVYYVYDTYGARISGAGQVMDPDGIALSTGAAWQINSCTTFDGVNYLTAFEDWRSGPPTYDADLWAMFVSPSGQPLADSAFRIAGGARAQQEPDGVFGGGQHFIVYETMVNGINQVRGVRILPNGTVLDPAGILVANNEPTAETLRPQVACNGQKYCVVWYDNYLLPGQEGLQFALVRFDGTIERGPVNVPLSDLAGIDFDVASNGAEFMLSWVDENGVQATRISGAGAILGTSTVMATAMIVDGNTIGWNGTSYLTMWRSGTFGDSHISARRISPAGAPLGAVITLASGDFYSSPVAVLQSGSDFLSTWVRRSQGAQGDTFDLQYARVDPNGVVQGLPVLVHHSDSPGLYGAASVATGPAGRAMMAVSQWTDMPYNGPRVIGRIFSHAGACYPNCDGSTTPPLLNVNDFVCFQARFAASDPYADCDHSSTLNVLDFVCFQQQFAAGCP